MKNFNNKELREILLFYEVREPGSALVNSTKRLMHSEIAQISTVVSYQAEWVLMLVGLAIAMSLCLFYMFTVGTILWFVLPANLVALLRHSMYAFTAAGGSFLAGVFIVFFFKQFQAQQALRTGQMS